MTDRKAPTGALDRVREQVQGNPATSRLWEELEHYLEARAEHAVTDVGDRLGRAANRLAQPGSGGDLFSAVGRKLGEGASPGKMALQFGASRVKDATTKAVKSLGGKGGDDGGGGGNGKAAAPKVLTIIEDIDVGVPVREAYNQWTQFEEFGRFAKGVVSVEQQDDTATEWRVKVAKAQRSWRAKITEQVPDEKIAWTSEGDKGTTRGVVTFHELDENLTRVLLVIEYSPRGSSRRPDACSVPRDAASGWTSSATAPS
ncbi:SRPBCC family protein [Streptacidiphilus monticola]